MGKRKVKSLTAVVREDRKAMVRFMEVGVDTETIRKAYPEYTVQQIAAIRAHKTMGNYIFD